MSLSLVRYPLKGHRAPAVSARLMEDCGLLPLLSPYLDAPEAYLTADPEALTERSAVLRTLLGDAPLLEAFRALKARLDELQYVRQSRNMDPVRILDSLRILPEVCGAVQGILDRLAALPAGPLAGFESELWACAGELFCEGYADFFALRLPERPVAVSYRLRFDDEARLSEVALSELHGTRFQKAGLFSRDEFFGPPIPLLPDERSRYRDTQREQTACRLACDKLLAVHTAQGKRQADTRSFQILQALSPLHEQLSFFTGAAAFVQSWTGYCFAECLPASAGVFEARGMRHPQLGAAAVPNDLSLDRKASAALIGGENRGGKTTFLRTAMAVQVLFQMGLPVPAERARLSPADALFCVFDRDESRDLGQGKLGEELTQMRDALAALGENGFFAFNEPLTSTSPQEGAALSREALCVAKLRGARGVWVTHFLGLFGSLEAMNAQLPGGAVFPLRTSGHFGIEPGVPTGSHAAAVFAGVRTQGGLQSAGKHGMIETVSVNSADTRADDQKE